MINSPKVVFNYKFELAINNPDRHRRSENKIIKRTVGMFDYYSNVKKQAMNIYLVIFYYLLFQKQHH